MEISYEQIGKKLAAARIVKYMSRILLLLVCFFAGTVTTGYFLEVTSSPITLCQAAEDPEFYRDRIVTVEADGSGIGTIILRDMTCPSLEAGASVQLAEGYQPSPEVEKFYADLDNEILHARFLVTGRFDPDASLGCFGAPKAYIIATHIELRSEITAEPFPDVEVETSRQELEVRKFFADFQKAVKENDRKKVASMMMYPLRVNFYTDPREQEYRFIENSTELLNVYDQVFHESVKSYIANTNPAEIWGNSYFMQTGYGQIGIFVTCNGGEEDCTYKFRIKIINSNTIYNESINPNYPLEP